MANQQEVRDVYGYFEQKGDALCYRYEAERLIIEPWGENSLRVRASKMPEMPEDDWALLPRSAPGPPSLRCGRTAEQSPTARSPRC